MNRRQVTDLVVVASVIAMLGVAALFAYAVATGSL
jgi:hypothetical protein